MADTETLDATFEQAARDIDFSVMLVSGGEPPEDAKDDNGNWTIIDAEGDTVATVPGDFDLATVRFIVAAINAAADERGGWG
jgi:hypothetical protein